MPLVPEDATLMECLVAHEVLRRVKRKILTGRPSGQVIDQAISDLTEQGLLRKSQRCGCSEHISGITG